jgi:hypothetical protein
MLAWGDEAMGTRRCSGGCLVLLPVHSQPTLHPRRRTGACARKNWGGGAILFPAYARPALATAVVATVDGARGAGTSLA